MIPGEAAGLLWVARRRIVCPMGSLLSDIIDSLTSESSRVADTLRQAKILAHKIGLPEFRGWIDYELNGYSKDEELPLYRICKAQNLATLVGPGGVVRNKALPTSHLPEEIRSHVESIHFRQGVGELEAMANEDGLSSVWPADVVSSFGKTLRVIDGEIADVRSPVPKYAVQGVLDNVKNRLLDFALELQKETSPGTSVDNINPSKARNWFQTIIIGNQNAVNVAERQRTKQEVGVGDFESLQKHLQSSGVSDADLDVLRSAISSQKKLQQGALGSKVNEWIGMMIKKVFDGAWKASPDNAGPMLVDAVSRFLGQ